MSDRRVAGTFAALGLALGACGAVGAGDDPVATLRAFLDAVRREDCERAWSHFSRATQQNTIAQVQQRRRHQSYANEIIPTPQQLYCGSTYGGAKPRSAELVSQDATSALVSVVFSEGTHFAIIPFLSTPYREWPATLRLVREDGRWKVERPLVETGRPGWEQTLVGEVEVSRSLGGDPSREWIQAEAVSHAARDAVEAALMDPAAWPRFMPLVESVEPLGGPDERGALDWRVHFRAPDGARASTTIELRPYGHLRDPKLPWTTVQWRVVGHPNRGSTPDRPLFTGSWKLRPRFEGMWLEFGIVFQRDEWPPAFTPAFQSEPGMAAAVAALEREAGG